jgi:hypothetical protein
MSYGEDYYYDLRPSEEGEWVRLEIVGRMEVCPVCGFKELLTDSPSGRMCSSCYEGIFAEGEV